MKLEPHLHQNIKILTLSGRFDARAAPIAQKQFQAATAESPAQVVVNLEKVDFVDSTGLSTLVQALNHARQLDGDVRLCGLQQPVRIIFELTRLDKVFEIFPTEEDAVQAFMDG